MMAAPLGPGELIVTLSGRRRRCLAKEGLTNREERMAIDIFKFPGLDDALTDFEQCRVVGKHRDPDSAGVWMFLLKFKSGLGLCIWDSEQRRFIEEPAALEDYDRTEDELRRKYPALFSVL